MKKIAFLALTAMMAVIAVSAQDNSSFWDAWNSQQEKSSSSDFKFSESFDEKLGSQPERKIIAWTITVQVSGKAAKTYTVNTSDAGRAAEQARNDYRSYYHMRPETFVSVVKSVAVYNY